ncbi:hypothetical protein [Spiroplasma endosymbiont of Colias croceus]|uniref:hypothetical protein n=1 Tax=Spiroplasma endosymbiont of Colias croceus TaxID=3066310 RepID=UPI0030CC2856
MHCHNNERLIFFNPFSNRLNFNLKIINAKKDTIIVSRAVKVLTKDVGFKGKSLAISFFIILIELAKASPLVKTAKVAIIFINSLVIIEYALRLLLMFSSMVNIIDFLQNYDINHIF